MVREGRIHITDAFYRTRSEKAAKRWGDGTALKVRIEPEEEAQRHGQRKHLFGHLLKPTSDKTGYTTTELKEDMKARFLPDGMTSLTEMNKEQFDEFNQAVEQCIREEYPSECWDACVDAMALYDRSTA